MAEGTKFFQITIKPKEELISKVIDDEDEVLVTCKVCDKEFASEMALRNHSRVVHMILDDNAGISIPTQTKIIKKKQVPKKSIDNLLVKKKTEEVLSSLEPTNIMDLASKDISYIILKADNATPPKKKDVKKKAKKTEPKEEKKVEPITGPFECLQKPLFKKSTTSDGICHQMFFSCCEYSVHHRDEHTRRRKAARCQVCEKPLAAGATLTPYYCEICNEGFHQESDYLSHTAEGHVKLRPYECNICHKRFTQHGALVQHHRTHTGDRPYSCTYCPKSFSQKSGLGQHIRTHTREKPFRCVVCSKYFIQAVNLKLHMRNHTNVAPFKCGICGKSYKQSSNLNYHLKNHSLDELNSKQDNVEIVPTEYVEIEIDQNVSYVSNEEEDIMYEQVV